MECEYPPHTHTPFLMVVACTWLTLEVGLHKKPPTCTIPRTTSHNIEHPLNEVSETAQTLSFSFPFHSQAPPCLNSLESNKGSYTKNTIFPDMLT